MKKTKKMMFYLLSGTTLGVLFAPKKGSEFVEDIKSELEEGGNGLNALQSNVADMGQDVAATATAVYEKDAVQEVVEKMKATTEDVADDIKKRVKKQVRRAKRFVKGIFKSVPKKRLAKKKASVMKKTAKMKNKLKMARKSR